MSGLSATAQVASPSATEQDVTGTSKRDHPGKSASPAPPKPLPVNTDSFDKADTLEDCHSNVARPPSSTSRIVQDRDQVTSPTPSQKALHNRRSWLYFATTVWCFFMQGWNDGTTGPLLPRIQKFYGIGYTIVSLLFVLNCVGNLSGALVNVWLNDRWGLGKVIFMGGCIQALSYVIMSLGAPFPVMVLGYCLSGFGMAFQNAQANGLISSFKDAPTKLGLLHAGYGLGAFTAPFVATHFSKSANHWYLFFVVSAGVGVSNSVCLYFVFKLRRQEVLLAAAGQPPREMNTVKENMFKQIFRLPALHCLSIFTIVYVGIEVTLGGWTVTFIQDVRGAGSSAGYISSCFFGGLMMGRVGLIWLTRKVGPRRVLFIYLTLAIVFSVTIWVVPFLVENFIAATLIGILLGPMYPIMLNYASQILPKWLVTPSIGWIAATGQAGSAIFPFLTGVISSKYGIRSLQPFVVAMMATLFVIWALLPRPPKQVN